MFRVWSLFLAVQLPRLWVRVFNLSIELVCALNASSLVHKVRICRMLYFDIRNSPPPGNSPICVCFYNIYVFRLASQTHWWDSMILDLGTLNHSAGRVCVMWVEPLIIRQRRCCQGDTSIGKESSFRPVCRRPHTRPRVLAVSLLSGQ